MSVLEPGTRLVVASHNEGKVREIRELLEPFGLSVVSASDLDLPEPEETGTTFAENAELKARAAAEASGSFALSDDSGLEVHALDGDPVIYSARWAGPSKDFLVAMKRVHEALGERGFLSDDDRRANFICSLCLADPSGESRIYEGRVFGRIVWPPRGDRGFGYDPIFLADGYGLTFGEMEPSAKHEISHRAIAFRKFVAACFENGQ